MQYDEPDSHRTPMQWNSDKKHAGFTTGEPYLQVNDDYKERNFYVRDDIRRVKETYKTPYRTSTTSGVLN